MDKETKYKHLMTMLGVLSAIIAMLSVGNRVYLGLIASAVLILSIIYIYNKFKNIQRINFIRNNWGKEVKRKRNFDKISKYFNAITCNEKDEGKYFKIDDQTWNDLNMEEIYKLIDRTHSTPGEQVLYDILRKATLNKDELIQREKILQYFLSNNEEREKIEIAISSLEREGTGSNVLGILTNEIAKVSNGYKIMIYILTALVFVSIVSFIFMGVKVGIISLVSIFIVNQFVHLKLDNGVKSNALSLNYLGRIVKVANKLGQLDFQFINSKLNRLKILSKPCITIANKVSSISSIEGIDIFTDYFNILFLTKERAYIKTVNTIEKNKENLLEVYLMLGELDSYISISSYRKELKSFVEPIFVESDGILEFEELAHPLVKDAVTNSLNLEKGLIITGSNMSGKSTFLKTLAVNALFAQTIVTCCAKKYKTSFFEIMSSISPSDNIVEGKSYYLGEAEAILRIINNSIYSSKTLCVIDEIFRGTNPIERISSASEILEFLHQHNALVIVATHDIELTTMLKESYESYYFREDIDDNGLSFDYKIKKGVSPTRNAIRLLEFLKYPTEIIQGAENKILNNEVK